MSSEMYLKDFEQSSIFCTPIQSFDYRRYMNKYYIAQSRVSF